MERTLIPMESRAKSRVVVGCMTGTSLDGLDVALLRIDGVGLAMSASVVAAGSAPFNAAAPFVQALRSLAAGEALNAERITNAARDFALFHAEAIAGVLGEAGFARPDLVCVHGQTVFHAPPLSWQLFNPWSLAQRVEAPVVFDLRGADLAAGGQGAPITPLADWVMFRTSLHALAVVNLGGFCNMTYLPTAEGSAESQIRAIRARDVCACNHVMDAVAREALGAPFDKDGNAASRGEVDDAALEDLLRLLAKHAGAGRSLGTGDEARGWVHEWRARVAPDDLASTAAAGVGLTIAKALSEYEGAFALLAGGGAKNRALRAHIESVAPMSRRFGGDRRSIEYREAAAMAVLGALCQDRIPITLPRVTGVQGPAPVAGCWAYP